MAKELKKTMRIRFHHIENISEEIKIFIKRNQTETLELKIQ